MRPTSLKDNLNSDFIQAYSRLLPKKAAKKVLVYVESYDITYPLFLWSVFFKTENINDAMNLNDFHNIIQRKISEYVQQYDIKKANYHV